MMFLPRYGYGTAGRHRTGKSNNLKMILAILCLLCTLSPPISAFSGIGVLPRKGWTIPRISRPLQFSGSDYLSSLSNAPDEENSSEKYGKPLKSSNSDYLSSLDKNKDDSGKFQKTSKLFGSDYLSSLSKPNEDRSPKTSNSLDYLSSLSNLSGKEDDSGKESKAGKDYLSSLSNVSGEDKETSEPLSSDASDALPRRKGSYDFSSSSDDQSKESDSPKEEKESDKLEETVKSSSPNYISSISDVPSEESDAPEKEKESEKIQEISEFLSYVQGEKKSSDSLQETVKSSSSDYFSSLGGGSNEDEDIPHEKENVPEKEDSGDNQERERRELKRSLLALGASYDRGFGATSSSRNKAKDIIEQLGELNPTPDAARGIDGDDYDAPLKGAWRMIWTTAQDVLLLASSPIGTVGAIYQVFEPPVATNIIDIIPRAQALLPPGIAPTLFRAEVKTKAASRANYPLRVGLNFEKVKLQAVEVLGISVKDFLPSLKYNLPRIDIPGTDPSTAPGYFDVVYLDEDLLIIRQNAPGGVFALVKADSYDP